MNTVSIRELHTHTGRYVRAASRQPIVVTDRGRTVAVLQSPTAAHLPGQLFPQRDRATLPVVTGESGAMISEDRNR
jgi:prevent-host-death family protein